MIDFHAHVVGLDAWMRRFNGADKIVSEEIARASKKSGGAVKAGAQKKVRVRTGHLRRSIESVSTTRGLYTTTIVGTSVPYARAQDSLTPTPYDIRPKKGKYLVFKGRDGKMVFTRLVHHPGIKGNEYLTGTFRRMIPEIRKEFALVPKRVIARLKAIH